MASVASRTILLVLVSFVRVAQTFDLSAYDEPAPQNVTFLLFAKAMNDGQEALSMALKGDRSAVEAALTTLRGIEGPDSRADQLRHHLEGLLESTKEPQPSPTPAKTGAASANPDRLQIEFEAFRAEYEEWLKTSGKNYLK